MSTKIKNKIVIKGCYDFFITPDGRITVCVDTKPSSKPSSNMIILIIPFESKQLSFNIKKTNLLEHKDYCFDINIIQSKLPYVIDDVNSSIFYIRDHDYLNVVNTVSFSESKHITDGLIKKFINNI